MRLKDRSQYAEYVTMLATFGFLISALMGDLNDVLYSEGKEILISTEALQGRHSLFVGVGDIKLTQRLRKRPFPELGLGEQPVSSVNMGTGEDLMLYGILVALPK